MLKRRNIFAAGLLLVAVLALGATPADAARLGGGCCDPCCDSCCQPMKQIVVQVPDPCNCCCKIDVCLCVPACCEGEPCIDSCCKRRRSKTWVSWDCGYEAKVVVNRRGKVRVKYSG